MTNNRQAFLFLYSMEGNHDKYKIRLFTDGHLETVVMTETKNRSKNFQTR